LFEEIFARYGLPKEIVTYGLAQFTSLLIQDLVKKYRIHHIVTIHEKIGKWRVTIRYLNLFSQRSWQAIEEIGWRFLEVLWAYTTTWRNTTGFSLYELVLDKNPVFPIEFETNTIRTTLETNLNLTRAQRHKLKQLNELDENHLVVVQQTYIIQQQRAKWHDKFIKKKLL